MAENPLSEGRTKHIDVRYYFIQELVKRKVMVLKCTESNDQHGPRFPNEFTCVFFLVVACRALNADARRAHIASRGFLPRASTVVFSYPFLCTN